MKLRLALSASPLSNIIFRLVRGTLGFSASGTSAAAASRPSESLLGSMSVRSSGGWLESVSLVSVSSSWVNVVVFREDWFWICDAGAGFGPVDWLMWVWGWTLWLDGCSCCCCCSQRFFKTLRFPLRTEEGKGSVTCGEKEKYFWNTEYILISSPRLG